MSVENEKWVVGWPDGSGPEYITIEGNEPIAKVRWGCDCCQSDSPLNDKEKARLKLISMAPDLLRELRYLLKEVKANDECQFVDTSFAECVLADFDE